MISNLTSIKKKLIKAFINSTISLIMNSIVSMKSLYFQKHKRNLIFHQKRIRKMINYQVFQKEVQFSSLKNHLYLEQVWDKESLCKGKETKHKQVMGKSKEYYPRYKHLF